VEHLLAFEPVPSMRVRARTSVLLAVALLVSPDIAAGQARKTGVPPDALHQLNAAIESLVARVSPSVVQILVTGYGSADGGGGRLSNEVIGRRQLVGSGVIVDSGGYIVTNAHVVNGAEKIEVIVPPQPSSGAARDARQNAEGTIYQAHVVGATQEIDLAVLKIDAHSLPALSISGTGRPARQGEMVFAFGSPEGLRNTVTMGVVSAVARQPDPDSPLVYVQTDTPINPGNSGGALVDSDGELIGINTFILSTSGGNQGLGFAIPAGIVAYAYPQLLKYGHVHQPSIGALAQSITPALASGLHLPRDFGIIVSDVMPDGPAYNADLRVQDIIVSVDSTLVESLPQLSHSLFLHKSGEQVAVEVLRDSTRVLLHIPLVDRPNKEDRLAESADPTRNLVRPLSILGLTLDFDLARSLPTLRIPSGVIVAARTLGSGTNQVPLQTGDVIHSVNGAPILSLQALRDALSALKPGDPIVLQIDRYGQLVYISFSL
jgi:serine protease Do